MCTQGALKENELKIVSAPQKAPLAIHCTVPTAVFCLVNKKRNAPNQKHSYKLLHPLRGSSLESVNAYSNRRQAFLPP